METMLRRWNGGCAPSIFVALVAFIFVGCGEQMGMQLPPLTAEQQKTYNDCMSGHWSPRTDYLVGLLLGPVGATVGESHGHSVTDNCLAKAGAPPSSFTSTTEPTPATQPSPSVSPH